MFEKSKAKEALSYLEGVEDLSFENLVSLARPALESDPEWALNAYAYLYYSNQTATTAANLLTACASLQLNESVCDNTEFPSFIGKAKDALKYLEKCYIYDGLTQPAHYTALVQGYALFGSVEKALGTEFNTPDDMKEVGARFISAVLAFEAGEDVDLTLYRELTGEARFALEYAYAAQNGFPEENLVSIAGGENNLAILTDVFTRLNDLGRCDAVAARADSLIERDLDDVIYHEIVYALNKCGNTEALERYNSVYTGELYRACYEAVTSGTELDRTANFRSNVQEEIDELVQSMDYQNADNASKAFLNHQIREAILNETEEQELSLIRFVPCFVDTL